MHLNADSFAKIEIIRESNFNQTTTNILNDKDKAQLDELIGFKKCKWKLVYRASRDGFGSRNFHQKCDQIRNTLTVIKSQNEDIFGGFTSETWSPIPEADCIFQPSKGGIYKEDPIAFIFSLKNSQKHPKKFLATLPSRAIYCNVNRGPCFGKEIITYKNPRIHKCKSTDLSHYRARDGFEPFYGNYYFFAQEIEVFIKQEYV